MRGLQVSTRRNHQSVSTPCTVPHEANFLRCYFQETNLSRLVFIVVLLESMNIAVFKLNVGSGNFKSLRFALRKVYL